MAVLRNFALAFLLLAAAFTHQASAKRFGGFGGRKSSPSHSYPSSHGLSGGGAHSYPHSGGLSGHGSGHQAHTQQHAPVQHSQQASGGGGGAHTYPQSPGLSGHTNPGAGHSYPASHGSSGSGQQVHHHHHQYAYSPPQQIHYTPAHGAPVHYPVYHGPPPVYVQNFHDSGSRFSTLLTGLALYNLGRSVSHGHHSSGGAQRADAHGERCTLRIEEDRNLEVVKIPCYIISTFTDANSVNKALNNTAPLNSSVTTTATPANASVTPAEVSAVSTTNTSSLSTVATANDTAASSSTTVNVTLAANGTEVHNATQPDGSDSTPATTSASAPSSAMPDNSTAVTAATPAVTSPGLVATPEPVKPEDVKGEPVKLSSAARCFVEHVTPSSTSRKEVECGLLQQYAMQSMRRQQARVSAASHHGMSVSCFVMTVVVMFSYVIV